MKKIIISLLSIIFIISMITNVYAATGSISSGASADTVIKGKTFTVTLAATSDSPIDGMYTKFSYDKNVLSLESASAGENYGNSSSEGEILVTNNSSNTSPTSATLYTITFEVLDTANVETTTISFNEAELHLNVDGTVTNFPTSIENITISIKEDDTTAGNQGDGSGDGNQAPGETENDGSNGGDQTPGENGNDGSNNGGAQSGNPSNGSDNGGNTGDNKLNSGTENKNTNKDKNVNTNKNTNKKPTKLPQTGVESASIIAIIVLGAISIASYVSYRKYKNI